MTAKSKDDFLFQLHTELHRIGVEDNEDIFADFEEHFRESGEQGMTEEETCQKLGDIKEIARSYVDIESTRINSILANAIKDSRPHVSLTKPGRSVPAASVEVTSSTASAEAAVQALAEENIILNQPTPIREYTPEHIAVESSPSTAPTPTHRINIEKPAEAQQTAENAVRQFTPEHIAAEPAPASESVQAGANTQPAQPIQSAQSLHQYEAPNDPHKAEIPPQTCPPVGDGKQFRWSDVKGKSVNVDVGRLIMWICLDLFVFSWAIPALAGIIFGGYWGIVAGVGAASVGVLFGTADTFYLISRILFATGLMSIAIILGALGVKIVIGFVKIIRNIIIEHVKAVYGI